MASTRCCASWTARRSPAERPSRGCCAQATPAATPPPTTSLCWTWRWRSCQPTPRPRPQDPAGPRLLARSDSAGATHAFAAACRQRGVGFSFGFPVDHRIKKIVDLIPEHCWAPAVNTDDDLRDGAWVSEVTSLVDLTGWPAGSRLILRKERPHPGAQLRFTDVDGMRITAFLTDTPPGVVPGQLAGLELRHRQHARVENRIRQAKATGLRNLPCRAQAENAAWLEAILTATDLICWTKLICFADHPSLAKCEIAAFRYRVLHVAAQLVRSSRDLHLRIDRHWRWATAIATGFARPRTAFA
jgi:Transposase DDE domain group 1